VPAARLRLVGSNPTPQVQRLSADPGVDVTGHVADVRPYLWNAAVAAAPLLMARGIQNKVLEAVAAGLPAVVTPVVADGLPAAVVPACEIAGDAAAFADALVRHLALTPAERRKVASRADLEKLSWEERLLPLVDLLESAARARGKSKEKQIIVGESGDSMECERSDSRPR
jgi:polysaccharide biosynthesis protein PslH